MTAPDSRHQRCLVLHVGYRFWHFGDIPNSAWCLSSSGNVGATGGMLHEPFSGLVSPEGVLILWIYCTARYMSSF